MSSTYLQFFVSSEKQMRKNLDQLKPVAEIPVTAGSAKNFHNA